MRMRRTCVRIVKIGLGFYCHLANKIRKFQLCRNRSFSQLFALPPPTVNDPTIHSLNTFTRRVKCRDRRLHCNGITSGHCRHSWWWLHNSNARGKTAHVVEGVRCVLFRELNAVLWRGGSLGHHLTTQITRS